MRPFPFLTKCWMVLVFLLLICQYVVSRYDTTMICKPRVATIYIGETISVVCNVTVPETNNEYIVRARNIDRSLIKVSPEMLFITESVSRQFNITGLRTGHTTGSFSFGIKYYWTENPISVTIIRERTTIDNILTGSILTLVALIHINFGCALDWQELKQGLKQPIGPTIGFISQFLFMPLISYGLGKVLFPNDMDKLSYNCRFMLAPNQPEMQLGMFFTGAAPAGDASNMWAVILGGNINLSITMTTISNIAAFGMMPLWLFTLGTQIYDKSEIPVPHTQIAIYCAGLLVPLLIGYLIQRYLKRTARFLARILKGFCSFVLVFIVVSTVVTNLYLFQILSWKIIAAALGLPLLGYTLGWSFARMCRQSSKDALTIAIEAGIQNTGISIFLLQVILPQPKADLTIVVPDAVATMTPIPLLAIYIYQKISQRGSPRPTETTILNGEKEEEAKDGTRADNNSKV